MNFMAFSLKLLNLMNRLQERNYSKISSGRKNIQGKNEAKKLLYKILKRYYLKIIFKDRPLMTILIINTGLKIFATKVLRALGEIGLSEMENLHIVFAAKEKLTKKI